VGGMCANGNSQTITWANTTSSSGDVNVNDATINVVGAHSTAVGSESYTAAGSVGNGLGYSGFSGVAAAWN